MCDDLNFSTTNLRDLDVVAEVTGTAFDLDAVVQELLEGGQVEDLVAHGLAAVDGVLSQFISTSNTGPGNRGVSPYLLGDLGLLALGASNLHDPKRKNLSLLFTFAIDFA